VVSDSLPFPPFYGERVGRRFSTTYADSHPSLLKVRRQSLFFFYGKSLLDFFLNPFFPLLSCGGERAFFPLPPPQAFLDPPCGQREGRLFFFCRKGESFSPPSFPKRETEKPFPSLRKKNDRSPSLFGVHSLLPRPAKDIRRLSFPPHQEGFFPLGYGEASPFFFPLSRRGFKSSPFSPLRHFVAELERLFLSPSM